MLRHGFGVWVLAAGVLQLCSTAFAGGETLPRFSDLGSLPDCVFDSASSDAEGQAVACAPPDLGFDVPVKSGQARVETVAKPLVSPADTASGPLPLAVKPGAGGASARASLQTLRDYNAQLTARKVEAARAASADQMPALKPPGAPQSSLDIWSSLDAQGFESEASRAVKTAAGLDYKVIQNTSVGLAAERSAQAAPGADLGSANDAKVSAYVAFKAVPALSIDARSQWERVQTFENGLTAAASEKTSVIVTPRVGRAFAIDGAHTLEPYVQWKREIDLGVKDPSAIAASNSAGAGVNFSKSGSYAVSVTADVTSPASLSTAPNLSSRMQFKLPLE